VTAAPHSVQRVDEIVEVEMQRRLLDLLGRVKDEGMAIGGSYGSPIFLRVAV
jgi:hypothetical protein